MEGLFTSLAFALSALLLPVQKKHQKWKQAQVHCPKYNSVRSEAVTQSRLSKYSAKLNSSYELNSEPNSQGHWKPPSGHKEP